MRRSCSIRRRGIPLFVDGEAISTPLVSGLPLPARAAAPPLLCWGTTYDSASGAMAARDATYVTPDGADASGRLSADVRSCSCSARSECDWWPPVGQGFGISKIRSNVLRRMTRSVSFGCAVRAAALQAKHPVACYGSGAAPAAIRRDDSRYATAPRRFQRRGDSVDRWAHDATTCNVVSTFRHDICAFRT